MPTGCGTWPAFWMVGPDWPTGGEIDILEGVNDQTHNGMTLHTAPGCKIGADTSIFAGQVTTPDCDVNAKNQSKNVGCSIEHPSTDSYGVGLNKIGGGVYATQWTDEAISVYYFPRGSIPDDILGDAPNPDGWGLPAAKFTGACDIESMFKEQQIVFNTAFCGDWAGNAWDTTGSCGQKAPTCDEYVQNNPEAFKDAYWTINALKVYQDNGNDTPAPSASGYPVQSTVVSVPVPLPTENATEPAVSSGYATIPPIVSTSVPILSFSSGSYVLPSLSTSADPPADTSTLAAEPTPSVIVPTSEALVPSKTQEASGYPVVPTSAAATSKAATPTKPAEAVGPDGMPGFQWPKPNSAPSSNATEPVEDTPVEAPALPSGSQSVPAGAPSAPVASEPIPSAPAPPAGAPSAPAPPVAPTDAPVPPTVTETNVAQKTVYRTIYKTVTAGAEATPAPGLSGTRAKRFLREHRKRDVGRHARI